VRVRVRVSVYVPHGKEYAFNHPPTPTIHPLTPPLYHRGPASAAVRADALRLLPAWLAAGPPLAQRVADALGALVDEAFPASSWELPRGSSQAAAYQTQLLAAFDGVVGAAEQGVDVGPALEVRMLDPFYVGSRNRRSPAAGYKTYCMCSGV
jgi:hypothetical protein